MQRKVFWTSFTVLRFYVDMAVPLMWGIILTLPLMMVGCWWLAYRSDWFDEPEPGARAQTSGATLKFSTLCQARLNAGGFSDLDRKQEGEELSGRSTSTSILRTPPQATPA
jgi:hypothetical protein